MEQPDSYRRQKKDCEQFRSAGRRVISRALSYRASIDNKLQRRATLHVLRSRSGTLEPPPGQRAPVGRPYRPASPVRSRHLSTCQFTYSSQGGRVASRRVARLIVNRIRLAVGLRDTSDRSSSWPSTAACFSLSSAFDPQ